MPITKEVHFFAPQAEKYLQFNTLFHEKRFQHILQCFFKVAHQEFIFLSTAETTPINCRQVSLHEIAIIWQ